MVKFAAPSTTQGPLAGYSVKGRWTSVRRDPDWRGDVGYEVYSYMHHWEPVGSSHSNVDELVAMREALRMWFIESHRQNPSGQSWRKPDHVEVDAVYASQLSPSAGSQDDDPFRGLEGTGSSGFQRSRRSRERGGLGHG